MVSALPRLLCRSDCEPSRPPGPSSKLGQGKKGVREGDVDRGEKGASQWERSPGLAQSPEAEPNRFKMICALLRLHNDCSGSWMRIESALYPVRQDREIIFAKHSFPHGHLTSQKLINACIDFRTPGSWEKKYRKMAYFVLHFIPYKHFKWLLDRCIISKIELLNL